MTDAGKAVTVADLMRPAVTTIERYAHLAAAAYLMRQANDTALVVIDDVERRVPIAVITDTDVAQAVADGKDVNNVRVADLVARVPITVPPNTSVRDAADVMVASHIRHLPVVDGDRLVGMVDISDACRGLMEQAQ
jgi:CBS domain-containing protein